MALCDVSAQPSMMQMAVFQRRCERLAATPGGYRLVMEHTKALDGYGVVGSFGGVCGDLHRRVTTSGQLKISNRVNRRGGAATARLGVWL